MFCIKRNRVLWANRNVLKSHVNANNIIRVEKHQENQYSECLFTISKFS